MVRGVMLGAFFNGTAPANFQSQGIYIGNGDQDNYLKVVLNANNGQGGIEVLLENQGVVTYSQYNISGIPASTAELIISVDPSAGKAEIKAALDGGTLLTIGNALNLSGPLLQCIQGSSALAVGIISTSRNAGTFNATWDLIEVKTDPFKVKGEWNFIASSDGSLPEGRHENGFVQCGDKFYLLGGRGVKNVSEYDPLAKTWKLKSKTPIELNHFQAVSFDNLIYVICAFTGGYPNETPVPDIYIYDPAADKWMKGRSIPPERRRGSAGVVVYNDKIYIASGITNGHQSGFVPWFDEYNPATNEWKILPDAPHSRDHFNAVVNGNKLYLAGGRRSSGATGQVFNLTVPEVDIYDFATNSWATNPNNIPTMRAGTAAVPLNDEVIVIGGESMAHLKAHNETEALNIFTGQWRTLDTLNNGRHATQAIVNNGGIYITGGSSGRGGSAASELTTVEEFFLTVKLPPTGVALVRSGLEAPAIKDLGTVAVGNNKSDGVIIKNTDGNQGIMISNIKLKNNPGNLFVLQSLSSFPFFLAPGKNSTIGVTFNPVNNTSATAQLVIIHSGKGDSAVITLKANTASAPPPSPSAWMPLFFINAGGTALVSAENNWQEDSQTIPSSYSNYSGTFNKTSVATYTGSNTTDAPNGIFNSYRWDGGTKGNSLSQEMLWKFPAETGWHKVDLYFTETYAAHNVPGKRVFDIMIEDTIRSDNFDIVAEAGFKNAIKKSYEVYVKDGFIHIYFIHEIQNPLVNGIAIYKKSTAATAEITPVSLAFGTQVVNTSGTKAVTVKNTGSTSLTLKQVNIEGQNASDFTHDFNSQAVISPGASKIINIIFKPAGAGDKNALLKAYSPDLTDTLKVSLSGKGVAGSSLVFITRPTDGELFTLGDSVSIEASVNAGTSSAYLKVNCPDGNFRKLKIGYSATNIFNPTNNVTAGGNNTVEIILKSVTQNINWNKIQIRPQGNTATPVVIGNYISSAEAAANGYVKIKIPLSAFNSGINFSQLTFIEFPYSAGAGVFEVHLQSITFTGGASPFIWFGNGKTDNKHDGVGGGGQLLASLVNGVSRTVNQVSFYHNNILLGSDLSAPYSYIWKYPAQGNYNLTAKAVFSDGTEEISSPVSMSVSDAVYEGMRLVIVFDQVPQNYAVTNATLKYDKDFAYSFTLDDGKEDAYTHAYPLFSGGYISFNNTTYPGLSYTDGCGNSLPFRAGLAWNSKNASGVDPHINTPGYLTWDQLNYLKNKNWNIFNHSLTHQTGSETDYNFQINDNKRILQEKTGLDLKHFIIPSGDINYEVSAFNNGMVAVYNQSGNYPGANGGLKVDGVINLNNFKLNRKFINDGKNDTSNIAASIDQVAANSINGSHFWYNDFTHKVSETSSGGSLIFSTFEYYMKYIEKKYGKSGKDNIWMAPLEDVYEYLAVRNNIRYTTQLKGNRLEIYFDTTDVSPDLLKYALTLKVNSDQNFSNVEAAGFSWTSFRGTGDNKIVNLEWNGNNSHARLAANISESKNKEEVLYRINLGGPTLYSPAGIWQSDSNYVYKNKTIIIRNSETVTLDPSLNGKTPEEIFTSERSTEKDSLSWNLPVDEGGEVEVRLYFAETYFEETNKRIFDVAIENTVTLSEFDIVAEAGKNKGIMKSFRTTSDGTLDINLIKIKHNPSISGMEIICLNNRCNSKKVIMSGAEWSQDKISASAYPNPFADKLMVNFTTEQPEKVSVRIYNSVGEVLKEVEVSLSSNSEIQMDLSGLPVGVYFMKIISGDKVNETIKVIKQ
ncbi:MAG: choice-of-anchor D domain-containing protein [Cytophagaceae bacterium]|nr:choice-of-anchor D domain-containing protein [Cytophagaceae bacterium]